MLSTWLNQSLKKSMNSEPSNAKHYLLEDFINKKAKETEGEIFFGLDASGEQKNVFGNCRV